MDKIDLRQFSKDKFKRKMWRCICPHCGREWQWEITKLKNTKEPLSAVCPECFGFEESTIHFGGRWTRA